MSSWLQLDVRNLRLGRRHLVNAYEIKAGIGVIAGKTVWSMHERLKCKGKGKGMDLYSAFIVVPHSQGAQVRIIQCYLQITSYLPLANI